MLDMGIGHTKYAPEEDSGTRATAAQTDVDADAGTDCRARAPSLCVGRRPSFSVSFFASLCCERAVAGRDPIGGVLRATVGSVDSSPRSDEGRRR